MYHLRHDGDHSVCVGAGVCTAVRGGAYPAGAGATEAQPGPRGGGGEQHLPGEGVLQLAPRTGTHTNAYTNTDARTHTLYFVMGNQLL